MGAVNAGLRIYQEDHFAFAVDESGLVNGSALQSMTREPRILEYLCEPYTLEKTCDLAESFNRSLSPQFRDPQYVRAQPASYFRALTAARIAHTVPGSVGRKSRMVSGGSHSVGEVDFRPGIWLHADLVLPLAEWMSRRTSPTEGKPLVEFVKRALDQAGLKSKNRAGPKSAAQQFMVGISDKLQKMLKAADASMIEAGDSFEDRRDALTSMLKSVKGGQK
jgi:hypothetical protein